MDDNCCEELKSIAKRLMELAASMEKDEAMEPKEETKKPQSVGDLKAMSEAMSKKEEMKDA